MLTVDDVRHVAGMVLHDNQGNVLTEAMCRGLEEAIAHYCHQISIAAEKAAKLPVEEK